MRIISRLDIKNEYVIKGINLEGLRKIGSPIEISKKYYDDGIDEIIYIDSVASLYRRNSLLSLISKLSENVFVPLTVGGGIRSLLDIENALKSGADKVAINSYATENPKFIFEASKNFGSSTIITYIETRYNEENSEWEVFKYAGREKTSIRLIDWIQIVQERGSGEILLTSIDSEGTMKGFDYGLLKKIKKYIKIPIIISGGFGSIDDVKKIKNNFNNFSIAIASALHYKKITIKEIKNYID